MEPPAAPPRLRATATHLYPGARLLGAAAPGAATLAFADGVETLAEIEADGVTLAAAPHRTARGAAIPARRWRLRPTEEGFRVVGRAPPGAERC
jgi:hypothetical protein